MNYYEEDVKSIENEIKNRCSIEGLLEYREIILDGIGDLEELIDSGVDMIKDLNTYKICLGLLDNAIQGGILC